MKKILALIFCVFSFFPWAAHAQTVSKLCVASTNSQGQNTCIPVSSTNPLPISTSFISRGTKFTATGCTLSTTVGGATSGSFVSGTSGTCTVVITMNGATGLTAPNGWSCFANDLTTPTDLINQIAPASTTQATISGTTASGDVINFGCTGY